MVGSTFITTYTLDIGQAGTLTTDAITELHGAIGAQEVTVTGYTILFQSISEVTIATQLTMITSRIVETFQTLAGVSITITSVVDVNVVATVTFLTGAARYLWIAKVVVGTNITTWSIITILAMTDHVIVAHIQRTVIGMGIATGNGVGTTTGTATDFTAQIGISIVTMQTGITAIASGEVGTVQTLASASITLLGMTIALTGLAVGEIPETRLTLITFAAIGIRVAGTLTR